MLPLDPPLPRTACRASIDPSIQLPASLTRRCKADPDDAAALTELAHFVLERSPENIWARCTLANYAESEVVHDALLRDAIRIGMQLWAPEIHGDAAVMWGHDTDTRPFLGAVMAYGVRLAAVGDRDGARNCLGFLLRLAPDDPMEAVAAFQEVGVVVA